MQFITAVYGFLVGKPLVLILPLQTQYLTKFLVFWGAAIVLFLTKMINLHNPVTQGFWVEISSQIENGMVPLTKSEFLQMITIFCV